MTQGRHRRRWLLGITLSWLMLAGCATQPATAENEPASKSKPEQTDAWYDGAGIYAVDSREKLSRSELFDRLQTATFVVVGESHGVEWNHRIQSEVYRGLLDRHAGSVALGMEMFQRPYQPALDAYVRGDIGEEAMLQRTEYDDRWGVAPRYYRPLWELAKSNTAPIVALNVRAELTHAVARMPLEELPDELRADLPEDMSDYGKQRAFLKDVFGTHHPSTDGHSGTSPSGKNAAFEQFARAQIVWDATMAQTARSFMRNHDDLQAMMLVCGRAHAHRGFGIPPRIEASLNSRADADDEVVTLLPTSIEALRQSRADGPMAQLNRPDAADYLWVKDRSR